MEVQSKVLLPKTSISAVTEFYPRTCFLPFT